MRQNDIVALWERKRGELKVFLKWLPLSILSGTGVGFAGTGFLFCIRKATEFRLQAPWIIWLLPLAGILIVFYTTSAASNNPKEQIWCFWRCVHLNRYHCVWRR